MQLLRKIFFYIFTIIYIIFCPLIILYAYGIIFKSGTEKGIVETGLVYLSTAPAGATIYLRGDPQKQSTPSIVRDLLPGEYPIKLALKGYKPWAQIIPVEVEKATVMDKVLLLPNEWQSKVLLSGPLNDLVPVPGTDFFLAKSGPKLGDVLVCNYKEGKARGLVKADSRLRELKVLSFFTVEKSTAILIHAAATHSEKFLWTRLNGNNNGIKDVTELLSFKVKPEKIEWLPGNEKLLFAFQDGYINQIDVEKSLVYPEYIKNIRGYGLYNDSIYILTDDNVFLRTDYNKNSKKVLLDDPDIALSIFGQKGFFGIDVLSEDFILFRGEKGELLANRLPYHFVDKGVKGIEFYSDLKRVLVWQKNRIGVLDFSTEETGDLPFEKGPKFAWIYTQGKNIEQAFWVFEGSHILFRDGSDIYLIEIEAYGEFKLDLIFTVKTGSSVFYSEETGEMYYLDSATGELLSVEIVPDKGVITLPFPEIEKEKKDNKIEELWTSTSQEPD